MSQELAKAISETQLSEEEISAVLGDASSFMLHGGLPVASFFALTTSLKSDLRPGVVEAVVSALGFVNNGYLPPEYRSAAAAYIRELYGIPARRLGWTSHGRDSDVDESLRSMLVPFVARSGRDPVLIAQARQMTDAWLDAPSDASARIWANVILTAARFGDRELFLKMLAALGDRTKPDQRALLIKAIGLFPDPELTPIALRYLLDPRFDIREVFFPLCFGPDSDPATNAVVIGFVEQHVGELLQRLPDEGGSNYASYLPLLGEYECTKDTEDRLERIVHNDLSSLKSATANYEQIRGRINACRCVKYSPS
jgi:cytosol alanyl aminopeptidase